MRLGDGKHGHMIGEAAVGGKLLVHAQLLGDGVVVDGPACHGFALRIGNLELGDVWIQVVELGNHFVGDRTVFAHGFLE